MAIRQHDWAASQAVAEERRGTSGQEHLRSGAAPGGILLRGSKGEGEAMRGGESGSPFLNLRDLRLAPRTQKGCRNLRALANHALSSPKDPPAPSGGQRTGQDQPPHPRSPLPYKSHRIFTTLRQQGSRTQPNTPLQMGRLSPTEGMWLPAWPRARAETGVGTLP